MQFQEKNPSNYGQKALCEKKHLKGRFRSSWTIQKKYASIPHTHADGAQPPRQRRDMATFGNQIMIVGPPHNYSPPARTRLEANR